MKKQLFYSLVTVCLCMYAAQIYAQTVGLLHNSNETFNGYTLFAPSASTNTYLIDNCGYVINSWESEYRPGLSAYLLENGNLMRTIKVNSTSFFGGGIGGGVQLFNWEGDLLWTYIYANTQHHQHHDVEYLPNGNILMIAWETKTGTEALALGRTTVGAAIWPDHVIEIEPVGTNEGNVVWEWHAWDHLVQDTDPEKPNYGNIADHPERIDINLMTGGLGPGGGTDWMHCNAVNYNAEFDQIIVNSKNMNEFFIIDHSTTIEEAASSNGGNYGKGGDILYRWGNPQNYQRGNNDDRQLFGQHDAQWIANGMPNEGKILIYNNGGGRPEGNYSSVDIIDVPVNPDGSYHVPDVHAFGPAGLFWSYFTNASFYSQNISGAQQQPNGNVLICEGNNGHLFEVTANGHVVWEYVNPVGSAGTVSQGQTAVGNSVFRTYRYAPEYPAFDGKDLTPGSTVESNPTPYNCEYPQNVWLAPCTNTFQGKVWLEGAYNQNNGLMRNTLTDINLLPNQQPFNGAPWLYDGTEITDFASIAMYDIVDWVLLEARSSADITAVVTQKAVLLRNDGTLIDVNGDDDLCFDEALIENESYYWVLRTRNHLDVISQNTAVVPNEFIIDFCQPDAIMGGEQQLTLVENSYMLLAGDFNGDGIITVNDFNRYAAESSAVNAYIYADLNCDASVTVADFNLYLSNASVIGVTAIRY